MNGEGDEKMPDFPMKFHIIMDKEGEKEILYENGNNTVHKCSENAVVDAILDYTQDQLKKYVHYRAFTHNTSKDCMRYWKSRARPIPKPQATAFQNQGDVLCFHRIPDVPVD